jgi:hypothetical protein
MPDEARLNEILDIVEQARAEGDTATEQRAIAAYRTESGAVRAPIAPAAPALRPTRMQALQEGMQRQYGIADNIGGAISEPVTTMLTGGAGMVAGGLAGLAQGAKNLVSPGMPAADRVQQVSSALTYEPRTAAGQAVTAGAGKVLGYPFRKLAEGADKAGQVVSDVTGSPAAGAATNTAIQSLPAVLLRGKVGNGNRRPGRAGSPVESAETAPRAAAPAKAERPAGLGKVSGDAPTLEKLQADKNAAYKKAEETGIVVSRSALNRLKTELVNDMKEQGLNKTLHPDTAAAFKEILDAKGQLKLSEIETLRRIANDAKGAIKPGDARLGARIIDKIDDFEANLSDIDVISGDAASATAFKEARALNTRLSKARDINALFERAELKAGANYTQSGMENALRQEFKALALNKNKIRRFTPEEQAAIKRVASGSPMENALRWAGKFGINDRFGQIFGLGATASMGGAGILIPMAGTASKAISTRMTMRNASRAEEMMRRGPGNALAAKQPRNKLATVD